MPPFPSTDQLDRDIATMLADDARISFRRIAAYLGVTEGTVRGRVKRLQATGLLKLVPIVDITRVPNIGDDERHMLFVTIKCANGQLDAVREQLLGMPQVRALYDANAAPRLIAVCLVQNVEEAAILTNEVLALEGIREAETELVLRTVKYTAAIGPIATLEDQLAIRQASHNEDQSEGVPDA